MAERRRADCLLVERGLCVTRAEAQRLLLAGKVAAAGQRVDKPGALLPVDVALEVETPDHPYVSRGGVKLRHALTAFGLDPRGRVCLDIGASTGGFTDCLLQAGARLVAAVDVGYGQLHPRLRGDARVHVLERTNIRHLAPSALPVVPDLAVIDASFISLTLVLPPACRLLGRPFDLVALVKPQFEVGKGQVGKRGVVRDPALHRMTLERVATCAAGVGCAVAGVTASPLLGPMGNREFFVHLTSAGPGGDAEAMIAQALAQGPGGKETEADVRAAGGDRPEAE
jgi:23S rRNA (cytidine1920-2'-O)/16S rRNA (cytidine1409-2'-O)-methyltransferase